MLLSLFMQKQVVVVKLSGGNTLHKIGHYGRRIPAGRGRGPVCIFLNENKQRI